MKKNLHAAYNYKWNKGRAFRKRGIPCMQDVCSYSTVNMPNTANGGRRRWKTRRR